VPGNLEPLIAKLPGCRIATPWRPGYPAPALGAPTAMPLVPAV